MLPRTWRTRSDPFAEVWDGLAARLELEPGLEAKTLFEVLCEEHPGRYQPGQLRTLQRHVRRWRAQRGPAREVMFSQVHRPGEACQVDFTEVVSLRVTIAGVLFAHLLCVFTLPFSNWPEARGLEAGLQPEQASWLARRPDTGRVRQPDQDGD